MLFFPRCANSRSLLTSKAKMNESAEDCTDEFDYQSDFTQFLKEARNSSFQVHLNAVVTNEKKIDWEKKQRKSWKKSLFSWLKNDNKSKSVKQPPHTTAPDSKARRAHVSGPLKRVVGGGVTTGRAQRGASGPLAGLFGSSERLETLEMPYICLGELNKQKIQAYGPVYLVT